MIAQYAVRGNDGEDIQGLEDQRIAFFFHEKSIGKNYA